MRFLIVPLLLFFFACNSEREEKTDVEDNGAETYISFDKLKWRTKEGSDYPYRDQMLDALVYNDTIRELSKDEIILLLGEPDRINDGYLYYMIAQKRMGSWPIHTKTMVIKTSEDNTIDWIKIHE